MKVYVREGPLLVFVRVETRQLRHEERNGRLGFMHRSRHTQVFLLIVTWEVRQRILIAAAVAIRFGKRCEQDLHRLFQQPGQSWRGVILRLFLSPAAKSLLSVSHLFPYHVEVRQGAVMMPDFDEV